MRELTISKVGPISATIEVLFRRYCVLIGPQSNGKSTIAKILSTCLWMEKEACTSLSDEVLPEGWTFKRFVEDFHRMHGYINENDSYIKYESEFVSITYNKGDFSLRRKDTGHYERMKISYIPSDRNIVTMKDIEKRDLEPTNFRSFLFDWLECNRNFDSEHKTEILNLGVKYYYDTNAKDRKDKIVHQNGVTYEIPLYDASSGMQSVVPMIVTMKYLSTMYFENYGKNTSFELEQKKRMLTAKLIEKHFSQLKQERPTQSYNDIFQDFIDRANKGDTQAQKKAKEIAEEFNRLINPNSISYIIEEPEQNLFPQTQVDLVKEVFAICESEYKGKALITTHSPYILAAVNILLFAGQLQEKGVDKQWLKKEVGIDTFINPGDVSVYSVQDGECESIIDNSTGLIMQNKLDSASEYNAAVFDKLYKMYIKFLRQS